MRATKSFGVGAAFSLTVAFGYSLCTLLFWLLPGAAARFMNALFHGLDFRPLADPATFTLASFAYGLVILAAWAFMLGTVFAWLADHFASRRPQG